ncbi:type IV secretion system protein [Pseudomonas helleri]|uniref:type IV secretion system protein n=1 Tax=Pseudomonas helleri TaxID=1608996 RepID=UPI003FD3E7EB
MDVHIAQTLYDVVDASLKSTIGTGTAKAMMGLGGLFGTFWLVSFSLRSIQWLYIGMTAVFKDVVFEIFKVAFIAGLAFNVDWFVDTIVPFVTNAPTWMGGILSGQEGSQTNQVDVLINDFINNLINLINAMDFQWYDVKSIFFAGQAIVFFCVGGLAFILVSVFTLFVLKVSTTIMLAVGPVFIAFALFSQTRHWFMGWVSLIGGFMLTQILFSIVLALEYGFINTVMIKDGVMDTSLAGNLTMLAYFLTFACLAVQLPAYAATVMGGASVGGTSLGGVVSKAMGLSTSLRFGSLLRNKIGA